MNANPQTGNLKPGDINLFNVTSSKNERVIKALESIAESLKKGIIVEMRR